MADQITKNDGVITQEQMRVCVCSLKMLQKSLDQNEGSTQHYWKVADFHYLPHILELSIHVAAQEPRLNSHFAHLTSWNPLSLEIQVMYVQA